ncbi:hypothetical protein [Nocardia amikacinitolerans]|uniref:hypothetical protein n=1 Tax=Nocardia amikacinitolerans TaxID=756689 RepID=UPI0020A4B688|nr:hypothetical protein [Nocardia amikacinitolerans]MCP2288762.1 hypothetical protein [Nocardia amikacinitolerans]
MNLSSYAPAGATLTAGILSAIAVRYSARFARTRHGHWEAIKTDLEIAHLLDDEDPMKEWLCAYADVRLRAFAIDETRMRRDWWGAFLWGMLALLMASAVVICAIAVIIEVAAGIRGENWSWRIALLAFGVLVSAPLAFLAFVQGEYALRRIHYKTRVPWGDVAFWRVNNMMSEVHSDLRAVPKRKGRSSSLFQ